MPLFPDQETGPYGKPLTEAEILFRLQRDSFARNNLHLEVQSVDVPVGYGTRADAILEIKWGNYQSRFAAECKTLSTPKALEAAVAQAARHASALGARPIVVVPYLPIESLDFLEREGVSGVDLCGNCLVLGEQFQIRQDGRPNRFKSSAPIKNVFGGRSSLLVRCFLVQSRFTSLSELREFAIHLAAPGGGKFGPMEETSKLSKGTVSKVVQALTEDLIVAKDENGLRLVDPSRLLNSLRQNYSLRATRHLEVKTHLSEPEWWVRLREPGTRPLRHVMTGLSSAPYYGLISTREKPSIYVEDLEVAIEKLEAQPTSTFPSLRLVQTKSDLPYFDPRERDGRILASPVQTWLEMAKGGSRERDAARELENDLIYGRTA